MLIRKYSASWPLKFRAIKDQLEKGGIDFRIEHVGSTAVPGLDAKDIIDVDIIYADPQHFEQIRERLTGLGYYHNGNQGIPQRAVFKRNGRLKDDVLDKIDHHLYACPSDSKSLERHLLSRDYLRKYDEARKTYQQMKYELAAKANQDKKRYAALKELHVNDFIDSIVEKARRDQLLAR
ncbi:MAG: GrpB family protein [Cyclobacteriaceae bacterium]